MKITHEKHQYQNGAESVLSFFDWASFSPDEAFSSIKTLTEEGKMLAEKITQEKPVLFNDLVLPFEMLSERISLAWGPMGHMNNVMQDSFPALRERFEEGDALLSAYDTEIGQHEGLYRVYLAYTESDEYRVINSEQKKIVDDAIKDFVLSGVQLSPEKRDRLKKINSRLSELGNKFSNNIQRAQDSWSYLVSEERTLAGVPILTMDAMAKRAKESGKNGWLVSLHQPIYISIMEYCDDRALRELLYRAFHLRASSDGESSEHDNLPVMMEILQLRNEKAAMLGLASYNEFSLAEKTAPNVDAVSDFLESLRVAAFPKAKDEFSSLCVFAEKKLGIGQIYPWDVAYVSEKKKKEEHVIDHEELRKHFPEEGVFRGLFELCKKIYGISFRERNDVSVWDKKVKFFEMLGENGEVLAGVYADLYARDGKRPGAWMDTAFERCQFKDVTQLPVAYFNCNFTEPKHAETSFLRHDEVETVFHEFGHVLHHLLVATRYPSSGMSAVEWDAIEAPSQIMENWVWEKEVLQELSFGSAAGVLSDEMIERLLGTRVYQIGMFLARQLSLALFDWEAHLRFACGEIDLYDLWNKVQAKTVPLPAPSWSRYVNTFSHIFDGGYAAGYFSYLWAEVLALDMYGEFKSRDIYDRKTGERFRLLVLSPGGSRPILSGVKEFLGREPNSHALLSQYGVAKK